MQRQLPQFTFGITCLTYSLLLFGATCRQREAQIRGNVGQLRATTGRQDNAFHSIADLVTPYGYPLEEHLVTTKDGYILRMYRIPHGVTGSTPGMDGSFPTSNMAATRQLLGQASRMAHEDIRADTASPHGTAAVATAATAPATTATAPATTTATTASGGAPRPAVLLQHGLLESCAGFLLLGPGQALALLLADAGFDVWLGNARGNTQSRNHTWLDVSSAEFWAFSFDEMAEYDLPAELEYMREVTGQAQVAYVGFSQGATMALAALASQRELEASIKVAVLLAPVAYLGHIKSTPLEVLASMDTDQAFRLLGIHEFLPTQLVVQLLEGQMCYLQPHMCLNMLAAIAGFSGTHIDPNKLPTYLQYTPAGTSVQNLAHWAQSVRQPLYHTMARFDYGTDCTTRTGAQRTCNQAKYGCLTPPTYNLAAIKTPLMLLTGGQDRLADPLDVEYLREVFSEGVVQVEVHVEEYEHLDFVWAESAHEQLYKPIIEFLETRYVP